jgi:hypothetical protein
VVGSLLKFHFVYEKKNIFQGEEKESQRLLSVCVLFPGRRRTHPLSTWWLGGCPIKVPFLDYPSHINRNHWLWFGVVLWLRK